MNNLARCILLLLLLFMKFSSAYSQVKEDTTKTVQQVVVKMKMGMNSAVPF